MHSFPLPQKHYLKINANVKFGNPGSKSMQRFKEKLLQKDERISFSWKLLPHTKQPSNWSKKLSKSPKKRGKFHLQFYLKPSPLSVEDRCVLADWKYISKICKWVAFFILIKQTAKKSQFDSCIFHFKLQQQLSTSTTICKLLSHADKIMVL